MNGWSKLLLDEREAAVVVVGSGVRCCGRIQHPLLPSLGSYRWSLWDGSDGTDQMGRLSILCGSRFCGSVKGCNGASTGMDQMGSPGLILPAVLDEREAAVVGSGVRC
jgi:hypothetical protein